MRSFKRSAASIEYCIFREQIFKRMFVMDIFVRFDIIIIIIIWTLMQRKMGRKLVEPDWGSAWRWSCHRSPSQFVTETGGNNNNNNNAIRCCRPSWTLAQSVNLQMKCFSCWNIEVTQIWHLLNNAFYIRPFSPLRIQNSEQNIFTNLISVGKRQVFRYIPNNNISILLKPQ